MHSTTKERISPSFLTLFSLPYHHVVLLEGSASSQPEQLLLFPPWNPKKEKLKHNFTKGKKKYN
jgi:hypothetical protein